MLCAYKGCDNYVEYIGQVCKDHLPWLRKKSRKPINKKEKQCLNAPFAVKKQKSHSLTI
jgi:hypothetical protein